MIVCLADRCIGIVKIMGHTNAVLFDVSQRFVVDMSLAGDKHLPEQFGERLITKLREDLDKGLSEAAAIFAP